MPQKKEPFETARQITELLQSFSVPDRRKILGWAQEESGVVSDTKRQLYDTLNSSTTQQLRDKDYWLARSKVLEEYSDILVNNLQNMGQGMCGLDKTGDNEAQSMIKVFDKKQLKRVLEEVDPNINMPTITVTAETKTMSREVLWREIRRNADLWEKVREARREAMTTFENFDQKANQLFSMLSTVMKGMGDMSMTITRNLL